MKKQKKNNSIQLKKNQQPFFISNISNILPSVFRLATFLLLAPVLFLTQSCSDDNDDIKDDGTPPVIEYATGRDSFRPDQGETRSSTTNHIHVRFSVTDNAGIEEIIATVSSSYPGSTPDGFSLIDVEHIFTADAEDDAFRIEDGAKFVNVDATATDIYWENIIQDLPIAGPYDFRVSATDIFGNTTYDDQQVNKRFYLSRAYSPTISLDHDENEIFAQTGETVIVEGEILKNDEDENSSDIAFIWMRVSKEDEHDDFDPSSDALYEASWGQSLRLNTSGDDLPGTSVININDDLLYNGNEITAPSEEGNYSLIIWAEDVNGNVNRVSASLIVE